MKLRASKGGHVSNCIKVALNTHVMCCLCEHSPTRPHKAQETLLVHKCFTKRKRLQEWWNHFATNKPAPMPTNWEIQSSYGFAIINFHRRPQFGVSHPQGMELQKQGTLPLPCALGLMHGCAKKSVDIHTHTCCNLVMKSSLVQGYLGVLNKSERTFHSKRPRVQQTWIHMGGHRKIPMYRIGQQIHVGLRQAGLTWNKLSNVPRLQSHS